MVLPVQNVIAIGNNMILEQSLILLLPVYFLAFLIFGLIKGKEYLWSYSSGKPAEDLFFHSQNFTIAMAGLSVTALALFIGLNPYTVAQLSQIILFFSISFVSLAISWNLVRFPRRIYGYLSEILTDLGILSIGCGFLVFFYYRLPLYDALTLPYFAFIGVFIVLALINGYKYHKHWSVVGTKIRKTKLPLAFPKRIRTIILILLFSLVASGILTSVWSYAEDTRIELISSQSRLVISNQTRYDTPIQAFVNKGFFDSAGRVYVYLSSPYANCWSEFNAWVSIDNASWVDLPFKVSLTDNRSEMADLGFISLTNPQLKIHIMHHIPPQTTSIPSDVSDEVASTISIHVLVKEKLLTKTGLNGLSYFLQFSRLSPS